MGGLPFLLLWTLVGQVPIAEQAPSGQSPPDTPVLPNPVSSQPRRGEASHTVEAPRSAFDAKGFLEARVALTSPQEQLQFEPILTLGLNEPHWTLALSYSPQLVLKATSLAAFDLLPLHRAALGFEWRVPSKWIFTAAEQAAYGQSDFSWLTALAENPMPFFDLLPTETPLRIVQDSTVLRVEKGIDPHWRAGFGGSFALSGTETDAGQPAFALPPLYRTWALAGDVGWKQGREKATLFLAGGRTVTFDHLHLLYGAASGAYEHRFSTRILGRIDGGVALSQSSTAAPIFFPVFALSLQQEPVQGNRGPTWTLRLRAVPVQDVTTGVIFVRPQVMGIIDNPLSNVVSILAAAGAAVPSTQIAQFELRNSLFWQASLGVRWDALKNLKLSGGVRALRRPVLEGANAIFGTLPSAPLTTDVVLYLALAGDTRAAF